MRSSRCSWKCFATGLLISTLLFITIAMIGGLVAIPVIYARYKVISNKNQYSVMYAAEPEYANIYLYQWSNKEGNTALLKQPYFTCHISFTDTGGINKTLMDCLQRLVCARGNGSHHCLPVQDKRSVPLYFISTRESYLSCRNHTTADYWDAIDEFVEDAMLKFFNQSDLHCVVLNESSESVATWIAANIEYLLHPNKHSSTAGVLYLGVASVQLSHILKKDYSSSSLTHLTHLSLYGRNYSIYSDTRWCNGVDEVWKRIAIKNITLGSSHGHGPYSDSCLPQFYTWDVNGSDLMSVCTNRSFTGSFHFQNDDSDTYHQCEVQIDSLLDQASQSTSVPDGEYIAFGKFGEVLEFFNTTALNSSTGWKQYNNTLEKFCQLNWTSMKAQHKNVSEVELSRRCYDGLLVRSLLMKSYGFTAKAYWSIDFSKDTENSTWSLGYIVEVTNSTILHKKGPPYTTTSLILSLVELVILLVLFSLFLISVINVSYSDKNRNGYISIS